MIGDFTEFFQGSYRITRAVMRVEIYSLRFEKIILVLTRILHFRAEKST